MASACQRIASRISQSSFRTFVRTNSSAKSSSSQFPLPSKSTAPSVRRFSLARYLSFDPFLSPCFNFFSLLFYEPSLSTVRSPSELGCVQSLLPFHDAVAGARMISCLSTNSRSCRALSQGILCCTSPGL
ncbi:protein NUCLEAR FUSION DEFECTIVE 6 [Cucumis melo var. makuwa]|uniref:Protein NUCLEAR FUSION DEFECTIVE 6 n=1 Tax=Cucumis melo var. makuwa TaxID=1194695 RepID=A0A5A7THI0_CUCMM|nr:protein NUCLEAR FUSION DEFECTIVE 6 [Cucumis melo var. makuwa]TYK12031.1 protein NUCLEAR FUSION DEFECTIVE 6 [Cucumis melo var. makuwa]